MYVGWCENAIAQSPSPTIISRLGIYTYTVPVFMLNFKTGSFVIYESNNFNLQCRKKLNLFTLSSIYGH